jgi:hypothetical protein
MKIFFVVLAVSFIGVAICLVLALFGTLIGWCEEFSGWMRLRGWRYSTRELLIAITIIALALGLIGPFLQ